MPPSYFSPQNVTEYRMIELCECISYCTRKKIAPATWHLKYERVTEGLPLAEDTAMSAEATSIMSFSGARRAMIESYTRPGAPWFGWGAVIKTILFISIGFSEAYHYGETTRVEHSTDIASRKLLLVGPDVRNDQPPFLTCNIIFCREVGKDGELFPGRNKDSGNLTPTTSMDFSSDQGGGHHKDVAASEKAR